VPDSRFEPEPPSTDSAERADWTVLGTAPDQLTAELWRGLLQEQGIPAMLAPGDVASFLGVSSTPCRLLVDDRRLEDARSVIEAGFGPLETLDAADPGR
jgi:hypothetical protein